MSTIRSLRVLRRELMPENTVPVVVRSSRDSAEALPHQRIGAADCLLTLRGKLTEELVVWSAMMIFLVLERFWDGAIRQRRSPRSGADGYGSDRHNLQPRRLTHWVARPA